MTSSAPLFVCTDVRVRALARSVRFYRALGLVPVAEGTMEDGTELAWLRDRRTGQLVELFRLSRRSPLYRPFGRRALLERALIFAVPDVARLVPRLRGLGARVVREFRDGSVRLTFLHDPDGTLVELVSWADPKARGRPPPMARLVTLRRAAAPSRGRRPR